MVDQEQIGQSLLVAGNPEAKCLRTSRKHGVPHKAVPRRHQCDQFAKFKGDELLHQGRAEVCSFANMVVPVRKLSDISCCGHRFVRLGTASLLSDGGGPFINLEKLDLRKYAARPCLARALCDYMLQHERNPKRSLELCAHATASNKFEVCLVLYWQNGHHCKCCHVHIRQALKAFSICYLACCVDTVSRVTSSTSANFPILQRHKQWCKLSITESDHLQDIMHSHSQTCQTGLSST